VPEHPTSGKRICAVLVSFHPDPELPIRVGRILAQMGALVVVDNGSGEAPRRMLEEMAADPRISLELNGENLGIARALNIGIRRAAQLGYEWVLLLDQDSLPDAGMSDAMIAVHAGFPDPARLAVLGAGFRDVHKPDPGVDGSSGRPESPGRPSEGSAAWEEVESVITSGSLLSVAMFDRIGAFRDEFFIDYVDADFCFRARSLGFRVVSTRKPLMSHAIGASTRHGILGIHRWTSNHSADRRYYIARNDTVMLKEHGRLPGGAWALKSLGRRIRTAKRILLYEDAKWSKLAAVAQGWWHGVWGKLGPRHRAARG
jgi:rhamnosyltransferase